MVNFGFAFNNAQFSDRVLQFEVLGDTDSPSDSLDDQSPLENSESPNHEQKIETQYLHVNSVILAAHSDYFLRLFSNGMSESRSEVAVVQVTERERQGLYDLIEYMYTGHLREPYNAETAIVLLSLADRLAISSCMEPLVDVFKRFPRTITDCLLVLGLPDTLKSNKTVQPVVEHYRDYLSQQFSDLSAKKADFLSLTLEGVKVVLDSESLNVQYEEEVFYHLLDWIETNCHDLETKTRAAEEIAEVVRFPWTTGDFLEDVVANCPFMQSQACQALILEALKFKSFTHARQQLMIWKKNHHNRYRYRNNVILENFWGNSKTYVIQRTELSCQVYFEFPLELVICTGDNFQSRAFTLGPNKYTFYLEARPGPVKGYTSQLTCCISLVLAPNPSGRPSQSNSPLTLLEYSIAMKRDYSQFYDTKATGCFDLKSAEVAGTCIQFNDFFSGWFIERGYTFPRWNLTVTGSVFFRLDLNLKEVVTLN